jgi:hypothetical protein
MMALPQLTRTQSRQEAAGYRFVARAALSARLPLLCSASGYVLRGASVCVFSLLSDKSLVELQHIIGTE